MACIMFCGSISWFICFSVAAVIAINYSQPGSTTESRTVEPHQELTQTAGVDLPGLLDAGERAVVTLVAGSTRLAAHKAVLAARSHVFAAIFGHDTLEDSGGQVAVTDVEGPVLRHLLAYLYSLKAPQLPSMAPQLLVAADLYGVLGLKADCERQVAEQLSVETAAATAVLAVRHSVSLKHAAVDFIRAHYYDVVRTQGWADARRSHPQDLLEVIQLLSEPSAGSSAPSPAAADGSGATPAPATASAAPRAAAAAAAAATQPHSAQSAASAPPSTAARRTPPPEDPAVSRLRSLSAEEKGRRLILAAKEGAVGELQSLLAAGADVGARDSKMRTALHWAAYKGHLEAASCLLRNGADVDATSERHRTPLLLAVGRGHTAVARLLLEAGAEVNARTCDQNTPLHSAADTGETAMARLLLAFSADPNVRNKDRTTPLLYAASHGHADIVTMLLAAGADVDARNIYGKTPLHYAAEADRREIAAALLRAGADRAARTNQGETPLDIARQRKHQQLLDILSSS